MEVKIFATDIDRDAILRASSGIYSDGIVADLPPKLMTKYFHYKEDRYQIDPLHPRNGGVRAAQSDQGPAVHQHRTGQLPQPADLPAAGIAAQGDGDDELSRSIRRAFCCWVPAKRPAKWPTIRFPAPEIQNLRLQGQTPPKCRKPIFIFQGTSIHTGTVANQRPAVAACPVLRRKSACSAASCRRWSAITLPLVVIVNEQPALHIFGDPEGYLRLPSGKLINDITKIASRIWPSRWPLAQKCSSPARS